MIQYPGIRSLAAFGVDLVHELVDVMAVKDETLRLKMATYALAADHRVLDEDASNTLAIVMLGFR